MERKKLGILGAGQLGSLLAAAAQRLGFTVSLYDAAVDPAAKHWLGLSQGSFDDGQKLAAFAQGKDLITFEFENIPLDLVKSMGESNTLYPPPQSLEASCDRLTEKKLLRSLGIATAPFWVVDHPEMLLQAVQHLGVPCILKTRRFGYDGKGQWLIRKAEDVAAVSKDLHRSGAKGGLILEGFVPFDRELSLIAVRNAAGDMVFYDLCENHHQGGILRTTKVRLDVSADLVREAQEAARRLAENLSYVGTLVIEFFEAKGQLIANEFAPRVHNSGHWTIEGAHTSQFENHIRAIAGLPLGSTATRELPFMVNFIGAIPALGQLLSEWDLAIYDYGKEPRPGRKVGHATGVASSEDQREKALSGLRKLLDG